VWVPRLGGEPLAPRRRILTPIQDAQVESQAKRWLEQQVTETTQPLPWCNNLVLVAKKDGRIRVCVDCTPANEVTEDFNWPLPQLQDLRYAIRGHSWFSRIDLKDAFFRIKVPREYRHLTAFRSNNQTYQFRRMPFGLKTAPATFQRFMDRGLAHFQGWAFWYMDDILIAADSTTQLASREREVRRRLREMGCAVNEEKSESQKQQLLFAGLWVMGAGIGPNLTKLRELIRIPPPTNKAEAQSALGLVSYLRDFIPLIGHFTSMLYPDKHGLRLENDKYAEHWSRLLRHVASACTINHHWSDNEPADLYTDASQFALGVIAIQDQRIVAVASRKLTAAETRYSATDREHLGLVYAARKFRLILHRREVDTRVWSDHSALLTRKKDELTPRQSRWNEIVTYWIPGLRHVKGKENPADFISRWRVNSVGAEIRA
jgi:Reverse transcriptase (RNA-dependent DNA polymerase)/RNase H-like domain found in reverse transcriptase